MRPSGRRRGRRWWWAATNHFTSRHGDLRLGDAQPAGQGSARYIIPANPSRIFYRHEIRQRLDQTGVAVQRATAPFSVGGTEYPRVIHVKTRRRSADILDMFEPQDHPNDIPYPGGPPLRRMTMRGGPGLPDGCTVHTVLDPFADRSFPSSASPKFRAASRFRKSPASAQSFGQRRIHRGESAACSRRRGIHPYQPAQHQRPDLRRRYVLHSGETATAPIITQLAVEKGLDFDSSTRVSSATLRRVRPARIALWDQYGGAITSGWARFVLEQFEFHTR